MSQPRALATLLTLAALSFLLYSLLYLGVFLLLLTSNKTYKGLITKRPTLIILVTILESLIEWACNYTEESLSQVLRVVS